jgi:hypothetical protein
MEIRGILPSNNVVCPMSMADPFAFYVYVLCQQAVEKLTDAGFISPHTMHDPLFAEDSDEEEQEKQT